MQEASLLDSSFVSYEHSTTALACITLAERVMITRSDVKASVAFPSAAAPTKSQNVSATAQEAVMTATAAARLPCLQAELDLAACTTTLESCYDFIAKSVHRWAAAAPPVG